MSVARFLIAAASMIGTAAFAQTRATAGLDIMSGTGSTRRGTWDLHANSRLQLGVERSNAFAYFDGQLMQRDGFAAISTLHGQGGWESRPFGPYRLSFFAVTSARGGDATVSARMNLSARIRNGGAWLGAGRSASGDFTPAVGTWLAIRGALFTLTYEPEKLAATRTETREHEIFRRDSSRATDTSTTWSYYNEHVRTDTTQETISFHRSRPGLELRGDWAKGRWSISASALRRVRNDSVPATSTELTIAAALTPSVGIIASGGTNSRAGARIGEPLRYASIGMRFWSPSRFRPSGAPVRPTATAFALTKLTEHLHRVTLRVPGARTAELSGDFNQWTPVTMREVAPGTWEAAVFIPPGTHRINVRINGDRWMAPPGLPSVDDEFAGRVGIVVVR